MLGVADEDRTDGMVRAPGPVSFAKGTLSGTAVGMTYDEKQDILSLLERAVVKVAPGKDTGGGADITAGSAVYARRDRPRWFGPSPIGKRPLVVITRSRSTPGLLLSQRATISSETPAL